jgi:DNA-binding XRE family transcriptional regulator
MATLDSALILPPQADTEPSVDGRQFKAIREILGLSQQDLANALEVSRWSIIRAEKDGPSRLVETLLRQKFPKETKGK